MDIDRSGGRSDRQAGHGDSFGWIITILLGIVGAFVGGWVFSFFGGPGVTGFNVMSLIVAVVGAVIVLFVYGLIARRR